MSTQLTLNVVLKVGIVCFKAWKKLNLTVFKADYLNKRRRLGLCYSSIPSVPILAFATTALNFFPQFGHSYIPNIVTVILIFLSGKGATSSHVL